MIKENTAPLGTSILRGMQGGLPLRSRRSMLAAERTRPVTPLTVNSQINRTLQITVTVSSTAPVQKMTDPRKNLNTSRYSNNYGGSSEITLAISIHANRKHMVRPNNKS